MIIAPVAEAAGAVTLSRSDYEAPLSTAEDVADLAAVEAHRAHKVRVDWQAAREGYLTLEEAGVPAQRRKSGQGLA